MDTTTTGTSCKWLNSNPDDYLEWSFSSPINLGSVVFVVHELDMNLSTSVGSFEMWAGPNSDYNLNSKCNGGNLA